MMRVCNKPQMQASRAFGPGSGRGLRRRPALALAAAAAAALAGCGASASRQQSTDRASTASVPPAVHISSALRAQEEAIHQQVLASLHQLSDKHVRYGSIPSYLSKPSSVNRVLTASAADPVLAIEGATVALRLAGAGALATAVGPNVPDRIQGSSALHTPASFDVTFAGVHGSIPIDAGAFTVTDEQGELHHPSLTVLGGGAVPAVVPAGAPFTLVLSTILPIGSGTLRYTPVGPQYLAAWDFDVETD